MSKRVFLIVLDSFGIGEEPDAECFGDKGTNTVRSCAASKQFDLANLSRLGFFRVDTVAESVAEGIRKRRDCIGGDFCVDEQEIVNGAFFRETNFVPKGKAVVARLQEKSMGKDTTIGHWEIAGIVSEKPLPTYPKGFPEEIIEEFEKRCGRKTLCNKTYSGTEVIKDYGEEHVKTGSLIVYTSADSVFQIAAHEEVVPVEQLYEYCKIARELLLGEHGVGRVIARPFTGERGNFTRTSRRHDFSLVPPKDTVMDELMRAGYETRAVGKIQDIFVGKGISSFVYTSGNTDGMQKTLELAKEDFEGLCFVNLVDFDMLYGHRRDIEGYAKALREFDDFLPVLCKELKKGDILMITADHGCDPGYTKTTDHTREYIPYLIYAPDENAGSLDITNAGTREGFSDIGKTIAKYFNIDSHIEGNAIEM